MTCPCLQGEEAPACRADTEAMRIPPPQHLNRFCLTSAYRRCEVYRHFLGILLSKPEWWRGWAQRNAGERASEGAPEPEAVAGSERGRAPPRRN
jgi:hypothetical protein